MRSEQKIIIQKIIALCLGLLTVAFLMVAEASAAEANVTPPSAAPANRIETAPYFGFEKALYFNAESAEIKAVVVPEAGGRICRYELYGDNVLYENKLLYSKGAPVGIDGLPIGGHQFDLGPEMRGVPSHAALWAGPYQIKSPKDSSVVLVSAADPLLGVQLEKEITVDLENGELGLVQKMKNTSDREISYCLWDRTLCKTGGFVLIPMNKKSRFNNGWSIRHKVEDKYVYDGLIPSSPNVKIMGNVLVAQAEGVPTKIGADPDAGWVAYVLGRVLFVKYFPTEQNGNYTDGGNSVEVYWDEQLTEIEPLSPEVKLAPGQTYSFPEKWMLIELKSPVTNFKQARAVVDKIPVSPFKERR